MEKLEKLKKDALGFPERAKRIIVHNVETLNLANDFIQEVKTMIKQVEDSYDPIIRHAKSEKKKYYDPLKDALATVRLHVTSYMEKQETIQREAEEKTRKEEEERQAKEDLLLERAKVYKKAGQIEEADAIIDEIPLPAVIETARPIAPKGLVLKKILDIERIASIVETSRGQIKIPGIEVYVVYKWKIVNRDLIPKSYYKSSVSTASSKTEILTQGKPEDA